MKRPKSKRKSSKRMPVDPERVAQEARDEVFERLLDELIPGQQQEPKPQRSRTGVKAKRGAEAASTIDGKGQVSAEEEAAMRDIIRSAIANTTNMSKADQDLLDNMGY